MTRPVPLRAINRVLRWFEIVLVVSVGENEPTCFSLDWAKNWKFQ